MITLKEWLELVDYRISEGGTFCWQCYGDNAYYLDANFGSSASFSIVFDRVDQTVYEVTVCDYARDRAYRMINPSFAPQHMLEATSRDVSADQAWDEVKYVDLDVLADFIEKSQAIKAGEDYDTRVSIPITVDDKTLLILFKEAHERDITFNQLVEDVLREQCKRLGIEIPE